MTHRLLPVLAALHATPDPGAAERGGAARQRGTAPVCYRADRPLGPDAGSVRRPVTPGQPVTFRLLDGGRADRPRTLGGPAWARRSRWARAGDSLDVRLSTGTSGWDLRLVAAPAGGDSLFVGVARYLSDARPAPGASEWGTPTPVSRSVRVWREPCRPDLPRADITRPSPPPARSSSAPLTSDAPPLNVALHLTGTRGGSAASGAIAHRSPRARTARA